MFIRFGRNGLIVALVAGGLVMVPAQGQAQNPRISTQTPVVTFNTPGAPELDQGMMVASQTARLRVIGSGQLEYTIYIRTDGIDLGQGKPVTDLQWREQGAGGWTSLTNANQIVVIRSSPGVVLLEFRALVGWADPPGIYQSDVVFELAVS